MVDVVVVTGSESVGKSDITLALAKHYNTNCISEYARQYVEALNREYTYADIEQIAKKQIENIEKAKAKAKRYLFVDTYLIVIKQWFIEVFQKYPVWLDEELKNNNIALYLLCDTDIPWVADPVRENGGSKRLYLQEMYKQQLQQNKFDFATVTGKGKDRVENAIKIVDSFFEKITK